MTSMAELGERYWKAHKQYKRTGCMTFLSEMDDLDAQMHRLQVDTPTIDYDAENDLWFFLDCDEDSILYYAFFKTEASAMTAWEISAGG